MNPIPESAHKYVIKPASIQVFTFKVSKNPTVNGSFVGILALSVSGVDFIEVITEKYQQV